MHRRLRQIFENEIGFSVGVISLGLLSVAMVLAALFIKWPHRARPSGLAQCLREGPATAVRRVGKGAQRRAHHLSMRTPL